MKTLKSSNYSTPAELKITKEVAKNIILCSYKFWILFITIWSIFLLTRAHAQSSNKDQYAFSAASGDSGILIADFAKDLPEAEKLPGYINSTFKEVGPLVSADGNTLFFSRQNHPGNTGGVLDYEDIWYSKNNEVTGMWSMPDKMTAPINNCGPNSVNFISITGDTIILTNKYSNHGRMSSGLSMSIFTKNLFWSFPKTIYLNDQINLSDKFNISISYNKQIILTSQELDNTYGDRDIYITKLNLDGSLTTFNLGSVINTDQDESSPFLAPDYKTLYFASKGHNGFGGFDIFVSHRLDNTFKNWSVPENLGRGINSGNNEEFFTLTYDGQWAYFTKEISKENTDIYRISLHGLYHSLDKIAENSNDNNNNRNDNSSIYHMGMGDLIVSHFAAIENNEENK